MHMHRKINKYSTLIYLPLLQFSMTFGFIGGVNLSTKHTFINVSVALSNLINAVTTLIRYTKKRILVNFRHKINL